MRSVQAWLSEQPPITLFITAVTEAELRYGVAILPQGRRRKMIMSAIDAMLTQDFDQRILPFDSFAGVAYAAIAAGRLHAGRPISQFDAQIAAIAASRGAAIATHNTQDFENCGVEVIDPWKTK